MSDLPIEEKKASTQEEINAADIRELQRGINVQAALLESMVLACDHVLKRYLELVQRKEAKQGENTTEPKAEKSAE